MTPEVRRIVRLVERRAELRRELAALETISERSRSYGMGALLEALNLCIDRDVPLPPWLACALRKELLRRIPQQTLVHYRRWRKVRKMRDERGVTPVAGKRQPGALPPAHEIGYEETFAWVAGLLEKTPYKGSAKAIRRSYTLVENDLPEAQRYKRTYTKRTR